MHFLWIDTPKSSKTRSCCWENSSLIIRIAPCRGRYSHFTDAVVHWMLKSVYFPAGVWDHRLLPGFWSERRGAQDHACPEADQGWSAHQVQGELSLIFYQRLYIISVVFPYCCWSRLLIFALWFGLQAFVAIGDYNGHVGLGVKCSKEVATAIRGAIILAKLSIVPVRRGYWGNKIGKPHTVPCKVTGRCGSVLVRLIPAPRGTGIVSAPVPKKLLMMAGIDDCYTSARGCTATLGNFGNIPQIIVCLSFLLALPSFTCQVVLLSFTRRERNEYCNARQKDYLSGLLCSPFNTLHFLKKFLVVLSFDCHLYNYSLFYFLISQGHLWCHLQDLQLPDSWSVEGDCLHQVSLPGKLHSWYKFLNHDKSSEVCLLIDFLLYSHSRSSPTIWPRLTPGCQCRGDRMRSRQLPPKCLYWESLNKRSETSCYVYVSFMIKSWWNKEVLKAWKC